MTPGQPLPVAGLDRLRTLTGDPSAVLRPGQLDAIHDVVADPTRLLGNS